jgi:hypothetical protein
MKMDPEQFSEVAYSSKKLEVGPLHVAHPSETDVKKGLSWDPMSSYSNRF